MHSLDVAAVGKQLARSHHGLFLRIASSLDWSLKDTEGLFAFLLTLHDLGKFSRVFQKKAADQDRHNLLEIETQPFEPSLRAGDRLRFCLRANPTRSLPVEGEPRGKRIDPIAAALKELSPAERRERRHAIAEEVGRKWLSAQGQRSPRGAHPDLLGAPKSP